MRCLLCKGNKFYLIVGEMVEHPRQEQGLSCRGPDIGRTDSRGREESAEPLGIGGNEAQRLDSNFFGIGAGARAGFVNHCFAFAFP